MQQCFHHVSEAMAAHEKGLQERDQVRIWKQELRDLHQRSSLDPTLQGEALILESKISDWYSRAVNEV
jgi:hypothetical protein